MSLLPLIFRDMIRPLRMMEHQMRMAEELFPTVLYPMVSKTIDSVTRDSDKFQVRLDVKNFAPEEIKIKAIDDHSLVVEAKHESNDDNGSVSRQLFRKFVLPKGHDLKKVESLLSSDGMLTITAPSKTEKSEERAIPVTHVDGGGERS